MVEESLHDEFEILNETDTNQILEQLSDTIIFDSIKDQIENMKLSSKNNNLLEVFNRRFDYINTIYEDNPEIIAKANFIRKQFYLKVANILLERFDIKSDLLEEDTYEDEKTFIAIYDIYNFFIIRYSENLQTYFIEYILSNKKKLYELYSNNPINKKDLAYKALKKQFEDEPKILTVLYYLDDIILSHIFEDIDLYEVIKLITKDEEYEITNYNIYQIFQFNKFETYFGGNSKEKFFKAFKLDEFRNDIILNVKYELISYIKDRNDFYK